MVAVKKSPKFVVAKKATAKPSRSSSELVLPMEYIEPATEFAEFTVTIFGRKNIGKTSLAAAFPGAYVNMFEPGRRHLRIRQVPQPGEPALTWARFKDYLALQLENAGIQTIVIDTIDKAYELCQKYVCELAGVDHPNDAKDFGKTWNRVRDEFYEVMNSIKFAGKTPVYLSHAKYKTVEDAINRQTLELYCPTCVDKAMEYLQATADYVFCYDFDAEGRRTIIPRGNEIVWAACGPPNTFMDAKTGEPLASFHVGNSPEQVYKDLCFGFANKLSGTSVEPATEKVTKRRFVRKAE